MSFAIFFFFFFLMLLNDSSYVMHISYFIFHTSNVHGITITRDHEVLCKSIDIYHGKWSSINPAPLTFRLVSLENSEERASDDVDKIPWWCYPKHYSCRCYTLVQSFDILLESIVYIIQSGVRFMLFEVSSCSSFH